MKKRKCPKCSSQNVEMVEILGAEFLQCKACGFDESEEMLDVFPESRATQSGKSKFSPYKKGGSRRSQKV